MIPLTCILILNLYLLTKEEYEEIQFLVFNRYGMLIINIAFILMGILFVGVIIIQNMGSASYNSIIGEKSHNQIQFINGEAYETPLEVEKMYTYGLGLIEAYSMKLYANAKIKEYLEHK